MSASALLSARVPDIRAAIVGPGSVGATLGIRLAAAGAQVCLVARGEHLRAILQNGLELVDRVGAGSTSLRLPASESPGYFGVQDLVVVAVKAVCLGPLLKSLAPMIGPASVVLPALNGVPWWYFHREGGPFEGTRLRSLDPDGSLDSALDARHIIGCVLHLSAEILAPGRVQHTAGRRIVLGEPDGSDSPRARGLQRLLQAAGFECDLSTRIRREIWIKLIGNLSFNPVAALTGCRMDQICADENLLDAIRAVLAEGIEVARRLGIDVGLTPDQRIDIARQLGAARISMLQDLERGRPLELAAIVEAVLELAQMTGVSMPSTRILHALVRARALAQGIVF